MNNQERKKNYSTNQVETNKESQQIYKAINQRLKLTLYNMNFHTAS